MVTIDDRRAGDETVRNRNTIRGMERQLERDGALLDTGKHDVSLTHMVLAQRYAAYAAAAVADLGGDVGGMRLLTDRNNIVPLAGGTPDRGLDD